MNTFTRRRFLTVLAAAPAFGIALAACGSDSASEGSSSEPQGTSDPTSPPSTTSRTDETATPGPDPLSPDRGDQALIKIERGVGGFTTAEWAFGMIPQLLIAGNGDAYRPGAQLSIYPGPLLPAVERGSVDSATALALINAARDGGLLAPPPNYDADQPPVADVGSTIVTFDLGGGEKYVHSAYALEFGTGPGEDPASPARIALKTFVDQAMAATITDAQLFQPESYAIWARTVNPADYGLPVSPLGPNPPLGVADSTAVGSAIVSDTSVVQPAGAAAAPIVVAPDGGVQPTIVPWPVPAIDLVNAATCLVVSAADVQVAFETANQLTLFTQDAKTYAVAVRPVLPGIPAC